jgi:hypothetical protein
MVTNMRVLKRINFNRGINENKERIKPIQFRLEVLLKGLQPLNPDFKL